MTSHNSKQLKMFEIVFENSILGTFISIIKESVK